MGVIGEARRANLFFSILALIFPPIRHLSAGLLGSVMLTVAGIWAANHYWVGPRALSVAEQRIRAAVLVVDSERGVDFAEPLHDRWVVDVLKNPATWFEVRGRLAATTVFKPSNALSEESRSRLMAFVRANSGRVDAVQLALAMFRVGGPPIEIYELGESLRDSVSATWFFDALETRQLLADRTYAAVHEKGRIQPWSPKAFKPLAIRSHVPVPGSGLDKPFAWGVFDDPGSGFWYVRVAGDFDLSGCSVRGANSEWLYLEGPHDNSNNPPFGAEFFRKNSRRAAYDRRTWKIQTNQLWGVRRNKVVSDGLILKCGPEPMPKGQIRLRER